MGAAGKLQLNTCGFGDRAVFWSHGRCGTERTALLGMAGGYWQTIVEIWYLPWRMQTVMYINLNRLRTWTGDKYGIYLLAGTALLVLLGSHAQASSLAVKDELLNAVQALRQAVRSKVTSGYGVALEKTTDTQWYGHGMSVHYQPQTVKFWFSGNAGLAKQYSLGHPPVLFQSTRRKDGVRIHFRRYSRGLKLAAPQVTVRSGVLMRWTNNLRPHVWTYRVITEISSFMVPDSRFFRIAKRQSAATVKKRGSRIIITFRYPPKPPNFFGEKCVIVFDLAEGGMVTSFYHMTDELDANHTRMIEVDTIKTKWRNSNGCWLPLTRTLESHYWVNGKNRGFTRTDIKFVKFVLGPLRNGTLSVTNLEIPYGTFVDDTVHKELYHFTKATAARMLTTARHTSSEQSEAGK